MKSLKGTKTAQNLMNAFAGESMAKNKYQFYAKIARKEGFAQIGDIFDETAQNEEMHGKIFFRYLLNDFTKEDVQVTGSYGVGMSSTLENLKTAAAGENEEDTLYLKFAADAREEGFEEIAASFTHIHTIEAHHRDRFLRLAKNIEENKVFEKPEVKEWICTVCGYVHSGTEAPQVCPACKHPQGYYEIKAENF
ncbi:rubrerythrin family protein [Romboutsia sp. 1001216sp1]|uniref:rubrerythrin n=1 Tax=unclassified Romboutsia TaxID=2626894 RepID=UPI0018AC6CAB|nr:MULTISPECIES: rubrerythrin family protein [unclassified Romboutsia]MDB8793984.1 rubrerythrin family protein [Romboutsia sp. 1001216sp1]MDB8796911.1 rubrerythrin family protein [Romboutsia sp. 1001216sp1]MDB8800125.1 rubrerythrin family protein [Romboutsia sp. 1001216sp1]MDB8805778.1 rubrerythrin family protein [Romboutsia sp. 1001216sp1]MDB8808262.1 rubrerythrin family protein [Romboutsia sp. 1001216sp1]